MPAGLVRAAGLRSPRGRRARGQHASVCVGSLRASEARNRDRDSVSSLCLCVSQGTARDPVGVTGTARDPVGGVSRFLETEAVAVALRDGT